MFRTIATATRIATATVLTLAALFAGAAVATADPVTDPGSPAPTSGTSVPPSDPWD